MVAGASNRLVGRYRSTLNSPGLSSPAGGDEDCSLAAGDEPCSGPVVDGLSWPRLQAPAFRATRNGRIAV
jgi:hypothetical protein